MITAMEDMGDFGALDLAMRIIDQGLKTVRPPEVFNFEEKNYQAYFGDYMNPIEEELIAMGMERRFA